MTRLLLVCACLAGCTQDYLQITIENETAPGDDTLPVGAGLTVRMSVWHVTMGFGDEDPNADEVSVTSLAITGGTQVTCDVATCILVDPDATTLELDATTPNGSIGASREVRADLSLALGTFGSGAPLDTVQLLANTSAQAPLSFLAASQPVSGHVDSYTTTGPVTLSPAGDMLATGDPGAATIAPAGLPGVTPLSLRVVTQAQSLASIARFTANRELDGGDAMLTVYTDPPNSAPIDQSDFYLDGFDADGYYVIPNLPVTATGPYLAPTGLTGGTCTTGEYCFPHASLPAGMTEADTFIELAAGSADQRIPVHVTRDSD